MSLLLSRYTGSSPIPSGFLRSLANGKYYTKSHEWVKISGDEATIGITNFAQGALGDIVYVDLPEVGTTMKKKDCIAGLESVKAASDVITPISGKITDVNEKLADESALVNREAEGSGWIAKIKLDNVRDESGSDLMDESSYKEYLQTQSH